MEFLNRPTRNLFFTGKGGVGKTSLACAAAVRLADRGLRVLLVSTDPASNLDEVLGTPLSNRPTAVETVPGLFAMNLDPETTAADYRERMVEPYRGLLPPAAITSMEEQFSGSCTLEIAAFDEFSRLLGDAEATAAFDHVVFDTAPTGHTLRLLTLPSAWSGYMESNTTGTSCLGPLAGLEHQQALYRQTVTALCDSAVTTLVLVTRADVAALREAERTSGELKALGITNQHLVVNAVFRAANPADGFAAALQRRAEQAIERMPRELAALARTEVALSSRGVSGVAELRALGRPISDADGSPVPADTSAARSWSADGHQLSMLVDEIASSGHGVVMTMGKGGVGKTTIATAVAFALAERGLRVHLSTTDPAAHLEAMVHGDRLPELTVGRIDPQAELQRYTSEVLSTAGAGLDEAGRALLEEDLRSPCTEEIAVFRAFAEAVGQGRDWFVVLDTAPTGHTVLLLDAALSYHREVTRQTAGMPESVQQLLPRLRDPAYTRVLIVTLPEATPVHEAAGLQHDLERAGIRPFAWVLNQCLFPLSLADPLLVQRQHYEQSFLEEVENLSNGRLAVVSCQAEPPIGREALLAIAESDSIASAAGAVENSGLRAEST